VTVTLKSSPCPESATVSDWVRLVAEMVRVPVAAPAAAVEKVTPSWQLAATASVAGQLLVARAKPDVTTAARLVRA